MKKYLLIILVIIGLGAGIYITGRNKSGCCPLEQKVALQKDQDSSQQLKKAFAFLKSRKDKDALVIFELILTKQPENLDALWGKAEILRRNRRFKEAECLLNKILQDKPKDAPSLITLAYIRYNDDDLDTALSMVRQALENARGDKENQALAYMMLGTINSRRSAKGWFFNKIMYGTQIKNYFLKAKELSPGLPEVHLGLGTFYLKAPAIAGGNLNKALEELELAVKIAPDFCTANARLAQAYKNKGDLEKHNFYFQRACILDPENEFLEEAK
ncbi:MAG: hypothetical protein M0R66_08900 [Candidatus Omnitrophica bacterium]|nr:hypothetical protein [Candidatus Omnitrophota bacterium]